MAITKIHAIRRTINKSIAYICNPIKTNESSLLSFYKCGINTADLDFKYAISKARKSDGALGYHLIQSFKPGEVSEDEAHKIGEELAKAILKGKYSYVIATHNDKGHIHNHIIFCAADNINHKRYHDCKETYKEIRRYNDKICKEHNLSVIPEDNQYRRKSHSYTEWQHSKNGTSWKEKLKKDIDECLFFCSSYEQFLKRMNERGYEIKNSSPVDGKYISFKAPGQEKWIRGRESTLGTAYTREGIISTIENQSNRNANHSANKSTANVINENDNNILEAIDTSSDKFQNNVGLKIWANRENLKILAHNYTVLKEAGYDSIDDLNQTIESLKEVADELTYQSLSISNEIDELSSTITNMEQYLEFKKYYDKYRAATNKEAVFQKYEYELTLFEGARQSLKDDGITLRNITEDMIKDAKKKYDTLLKSDSHNQSSYDDILSKIKNLTSIKDNIRYTKETDKKNNKEMEQN